MSLSYEYVNLRIQENVTSKLLLYDEISKARKPPRIVIFSDNQIKSYTMWKNLFRLGVQLLFPMKFDLIPLPDNYKPEHFEPFISELEGYIEYYLPAGGLSWGVVNLGTEETPLLNLVIADHKIKQTELAFERRPVFPNTVDPSAGAVDPGAAGGSSDDDVNNNSSGFSLMCADVKILVCDAVGTGRPVGSAEYVKSMDCLRAEISTCIEESIGEPVAESTIQISAAVYV